MIISLQCYSQTLFSSSMEWANGRYNGEVTIRSFKKVPHGSGTYEDYNGNKYVGLWSEGKKNGKGVYYHACGDKVAGTWIKGKLQGKAKYYFADGSIYDIIYKNGKSVRKTKISSGKSVARNRKSSQQQGKVKNNTTSRPSASSSTTSSRTTVQQVVPRQRFITTREWVPCRYCNGSGQCSYCHGGRVSAHHFEQNNTTYLTDCGGCNGSGRCGICRGSRGEYREVIKSIY